MYFVRSTVVRTFSREMYLLHQFRSNNFQYPVYHTLQQAPGICVNTVLIPTYASRTSQVLLTCFDCTPTSTWHLCWKRSLSKESYLPVGPSYLYYSRILKYDVLYTYLYFMYIRSTVPGSVHQNLYGIMHNSPACLCSQQGQGEESVCLILPIKTKKISRRVSRHRQYRYQ